jgi:hypothetical protein
MCMCDGVLFVERAGELPSLVRLSQFMGGAEAKASPKGRAYVSIRMILEGVDPKLCELLMTRVKPA